MKKGKLKVGVKKPVKFFVTVDIDEAETVDECKTLSKGSEANVASTYMRGARIDRQDGEARDAVASAIAGKTTAQLADPIFQAALTKTVQAIVNSFDALAVKSRGGRPLAPVVVPEGKKTFTLAEWTAMMAASGRKVTFVKVPTAKK